MADDVQPPEGQGAETTDSGLMYDLDSVAPEIRDVVAGHLKEVEGNVTKKFQEAAEYRKGWAPYEELGLRNVPPETVGQLLGFLQLINDPERVEEYDQWLTERAQERGLFGGGQDDLGLEDVGDMSPDKIQELIAQKVAETVSPLEKQLQEQAQEREVAGAAEEITQAMDAIRNDNPSFFEGGDEKREAAENAIWQLAYSYSEDASLSAAEKIQKGFEDYKSIIGQGAKGLFDKKLNQPQAPEGAGAPSTVPEKITSFDDPRLKERALEKIRNAG